MYTGIKAFSEMEDLFIVFSYLINEWSDHIIREYQMEVLNLFISRKGRSCTGWKRAARVNCIILITLSTVLVVLSGLSLRNGAQKTIFLYSGDCDEGNVSHLNTGLHFLINVVSTLILASSNFFMQILNAPSREEVDTAHAKGSWLLIGVPSVGNVFRVSRFKSCCWLVLVLSSVPVHLLFNSAVFETDFRESDFHLTIATEEFASGGAYFPPGAGLFLPGIIPVDYYTEENGAYPIEGYGFPVSLSDYFSHERSNALRNISSIAANSGRWTKLDPFNCMEIYLDCRGLKKYRDVVLIINHDGWIRDEMWRINAYDATFWNRYVPSRERNNLFFDAQCVMYASFDMAGKATCVNTCSDAMGSHSLVINSTQTAAWYYSFESDPRLTASNAFYERQKVDWHPISFAELQKGALFLSVEYCLAQPLESTCRVGLSPILLLLVMICVVGKTSTAILATLLLDRQNQPPLVTLGDAIVSFIEKPEGVNTVYCTFGQAEIRKAMASDSVFILSKARKWKAVAKLRAVALPGYVWVTSYLLCIVGIGLCASLYASAYQTHGLAGRFFQSDDNSFIPLTFSLLGAVILANSPQLLLSFCYLTYNNLFTYLQIAREWGKYGEGYFPLRVTNPQGQQSSTYRLQLPYRYSLPLMVASAVLHWILSNTIYVFISIGGYYSNDLAFHDQSLPETSAVYVGYSTKALLALTTISTFLISLPVLLSLKRLPWNIVVPGCNSLAISAACHVSRLSNAVKHQSMDDDTNSSRSTPSSAPTTPNQTSESPYDRLIHDWIETTVDDVGLKTHEQSIFRNLAQSKLRWGVVEMPPEWYTKFGHHSSVGHLSFGVEEDNVSPPTKGKYYA
ncbi:hypothetical protein F4680DRAFT_418089 [Xylaria scruposa]|nr:hypothetical protein F4680DRAFT_418089 [Xylaria scruposa]